jgi:hypothetical protein
VGDRVNEEINEKQLNNPSGSFIEPNPYSLKSFQNFPHFNLAFLFIFDPFFAFPPLNVSMVDLTGLGSKKASKRVTLLAGLFDVNLDFISCQH